MVLHESKIGIKLSNLLIFKASNLSDTALCKETLTHQESKGIVFVATLIINISLWYLQLDRKVISKQGNIYSLAPKVAGPEHTR